MLRTTQRTRRQAMSEYLILVGLIGLLVMAAVAKYGFAVDEAIQGSHNALVTRMDPPPDGAPDGSESRDLGVATDGSGNKWNVRALNQGGKWVVKAAPAPGQPNLGSAAYDPGTHGRLRSN